jgi:hypothetical protein
MTNTLAYFSTELITTLKKFMIYSLEMVQIILLWTFWHKRDQYQKFNFRSLGRIMNKLCKFISQNVLL